MRLIKNWIDLLDGTVELRNNAAVAETVRLQAAACRRFADENVVLSARVGKSNWASIMVLLHVRRQKFRVNRNHRLLTTFMTHFRPRIE